MSDAVQADIRLISAAPTTCVYGTLASKVDQSMDKESMRCSRLCSGRYSHRTCLLSCPDADPGLIAVASETTKSQAQVQQLQQQRNPFLQQAVNQAACESPELMRASSHQTPCRPQSLISTSLASVRHSHRTCSTQAHAQAQPRWRLHLLSRARPSDRTRGGWGSLLDLAQAMQELSYAHVRSLSI